MKRYSVEVTDSALAAIRSQVRYIAVEAGSPGNAARWLQLVWDAVESLETSPRRGSRAEEDAYVECEVRQLVVARHLLLFTVDDARRMVWVIGLRHGHRLPRPEDLPEEGGDTTGEHQGEAT